MITTSWIAATKTKEIHVGKGIITENLNTRTLINVTYYSELFI